MCFGHSLQTVSKGVFTRQNAVCSYHRILQNAVVKGRISKCVKLCEKWYNISNKLIRDKNEKKYFYCCNGIFI